MVSASLATAKHDDRALLEQKKVGKRLGEVLIGLGYIADVQMARILGQQLGIPFVDLKNVRIEPEVVKTVPEALARRHRILPTVVKGGTLTIAMADPLDVFAVDEIRRVSRMPIETVAVTEKDLVKAYDKLYRVTGAMEDVIRDIGTITQAEDERVTALEAMAEETPVVKLVNLVITQAVRDRASDIHIEADADTLRVRYRVDGILHEVMTPPKHMLAGLISRVKILSHMDIAEKRIPQDGRFPVEVEGRQLDVRSSTMPTLHGEKVVLRLLEKTEGLPPLTALGFLDDTLAVFTKMIRRPYGFILATGPTGSGKTTTLYSALRSISTIEKNIITIEDPIEYNLRLINQVQVNPKAGLTFANGLRSILRQDPDIIMVGEIRDLDTAAIATHAALTGHLVLSTLHTNEAVGAVARLIDMGVEPFLIASSLVGVIGQKLIRKVCPHCRETYADSPLPLAEAGVKVPVELVRGRGCAECKFTGYLGREGLFELLPITEGIKRLIIRKATASELRQAAVQEGFRTMRDEGIEKVLSGITTLDEVIRVAEETD